MFHKIFLNHTTSSLRAIEKQLIAYFFLIKFIQLISTVREKMYNENVCLWILSPLFSALHGNSSRSKIEDDTDEVLNVDVDDTLAYGKAQYPFICPNLNVNSWILNMFSSHAICKIVWH